MWKFFQNTNNPIFGALRTVSTKERERQKYARVRAREGKAEREDRALRVWYVLRNKISEKGGGAHHDLFDTTIAAEDC